VLNSEHRHGQPVPAPTPFLLVLRRSKSNAGEAVVREEVPVVP
jgi:hypothetical protein